MESNTIVKEIHSAFPKESDKIVKQAEEILNINSQEHKKQKIKTLKDLNFVNSKKVTGLSPENIKTTKEKLELIKDYKKLFPENKFITAEKVQDICHQYGLAYGDVCMFTGDIPEKNINDIIDFTFQWNKAVSSIFKDGKKDVEITPSMSTASMHIGELNRMLDEYIDIFQSKECRLGLFNRYSKRTGEFRYNWENGQVWSDITSLLSYTDPKYFDRFQTEEIQAFFDHGGVFRQQFFLKIGAMAGMYLDTLNKVNQKRKEEGKEPIADNRNYTELEMACYEVFNTTKDFKPQLHVVADIKSFIPMGEYNRKVQITPEVDNKTRRIMAHTATSQEQERQAEMARLNDPIILAEVEKGSYLVVTAWGDEEDISDIKP